MGYAPRKVEYPTNAELLLMRFLHDELGVEEYEAEVERHLMADTLEAHVRPSPPPNPFLSSSGVMHRPVMPNPTKR